jgi:hypothetical protein
MDFVPYIREYLNIMKEAIAVNFVNILGGENAEFLNAIGDI